jgi:hypothetical protein
VILDEIEVAKVIPALILCHTVVKDLKYDICSVSTAFRAARLSDVDLSQSIFMQTS